MSLYVKTYVQLAKEFNILRAQLTAPPPQVLQAALSTSYAVCCPSHTARA